MHLERSLNDGVDAMIWQHLLPFQHQMCPGTQQGYEYGGINNW